MRRFLVPALAFLAAMPTLSAVAAPDTTCRLATQVQEVPGFLQMPPEVRKLLAPMAEPGQPFNKTDVIDRNLPSRRLIRAGHHGADWFVWYEQGGIAYSWQAVVVRIAPGGGGATKLVHALIPVSWRNGGWKPGVDICAFTDAALAGRVPPYPRGTMEIKPH